MCHEQQPLTRNTALRQKDFTERKGVGEANFREKRKKKKEWWGTRTCLCQTAMPQMWWGDWWGGFALKDIPLCSLSSSLPHRLLHHLNTQGLSWFNSKKTKTKKHLVYSTFSSAQVQAKVCFLTVATEWNTLFIIYMESTHELHTNSCPAWATAQQEWVCVCVHV